MYALLMSDKGELQMQQVGDIEVAYPQHELHEVANTSRHAISEPLPRILPKNDHHTNAPPTHTAIATPAQLGAGKKNLKQSEAAENCLKQQEQVIKQVRTPIKKEPPPIPTRRSAAVQQQSTLPKNPVDISSARKAYPSMETLAVILNVPVLMDLNDGGITTEILANMNRNEAVSSGIKKNDFFRIKQYFVQNPIA
jgi:hypothetical protein